MISTGSVIRKRILVVMAIFLGLAAALSAQLINLQVVRAQELQERAQRQWTSEAVIAPRRGAILDRNGMALAVSATAYTACVSPRQVKDARAFARIVAPALDMEEDDVFKKASDTGKGSVTLKRKLARETAQALKTLYASCRASGDDSLSGLYLQEDSGRYYPMGAFATQLLGLTTVDGVGQSGLEKSLDKYLAGRSGSRLAEVDGKGRALDYGAQEYIDAVDGGQVSLTIDYVIQSYVEQAAREALAVNSAKGVRIIAMNPQTGEILAMCVKPDYDPNDPPRNDVAALTALMRNRLVTDAYEPGSTFKILTSSIALDLGVTNVNEGFYCSGKTTVDGSTVRCWGNPHGAETMRQALQNSCNPVFVELGLRIGVERFYNYLDAFGIGAPTGVDIEGESAGILIARERVKRVDMARIGFGQSVAVTPIQLITAASAAVNGGRLMKPYVVSEIRAADGELILKNEPQLVARPISEATSAVMRDLLEGVVEEGGGRNAYIAGYRIGGKTGTAQVYVDGAVSSSTHIGSFIGFAPIDDPQIALLVIVDEADKSPDYGSVTAAPFARDILEKTLAYLGYAKRTEKAASLKDVAVPDVTGRTVKEAAAMLKEAGLQYMLSGAGARVVDQLPAPGAAMPEKSIVMLYAEGESAEQAGGMIEVPDVTGLSVVEANRLLLSYGFEMRVSGSGVAVAQTPQAGETALPSARVTVRFQTP
ncbi:MAG: PASTA domain-containing protein [Clostridia bacterium]|nr:PASTA domain-containing protein [Clostridia bacterium]